MPIKKHRCDRCGEVVEKFYHRATKVDCPVCGYVMKCIPSVPGYRRDHTVSDA